MITKFFPFCRGFYDMGFNFFLKSLQLLGEGPSFQNELSEISKNGSDA